MKLSKLSIAKFVYGKKVLLSLVLATVVVLLNGFVATMVTLWILCAALCVMFHAALWKGYFTNGLVLLYFVRKSSLSPNEVYRRGRHVTFTMLCIVALLCFTAR